MTIKRNTRIAALAVAAFAGLASPASAIDTVGGLSSGPVQPQFKWTHAKWKKCWTLAYKNAREDGLTPNGATAEADLVCGDPPL